MKRCSFLLAAAALLFSVSAGLTGCGDGASTGGSAGAGAGAIKIGSLQSTTGLNSTFGKSSENGIRLAASEINKAGGVLGKNIEIASADTESSVDKTPAAMLKLIDSDKVVAVLGEVASGRSRAAAPEAQRNRIPLLSPASTNVTVTKVGDYIFRSCFTDDFQGVLIAKFTAENLKLKKAVLLVDTTSDYSKGLADVLTAEFPKLGGQILARENYASGDQNFKTQLTNLKNSNPEIIFLPGYYTEIALIAKQARELGITCPMIGGDGWDSDVTIKVGGDAVNGCYYTNHYFSGDPDAKVQEFVKKYKAAYNDETPDAMAVLGYDAANIMFAAIKNAGSTEGPKIRDSLAQTKDFPGVTGMITIDKDRNASKPGVVLKIANGKIEMVTRVNP